MSSITVWQCDRCGEHHENDGFVPEFWRPLRKGGPNRTAREREWLLCRDCLTDFLGWVDG